MNKIILVIFILVFLVAWIGFPDIIKCPYKAYTGKPCLFCGTLTSFSLIIHCRMSEALKVNPIGVLVFFGMLLVCFTCIVKVFLYERI